MLLVIRKPGTEKVHFCNSLGEIFLVAGALRLLRFRRKKETLSPLSDPLLRRSIVCIGEPLTT